MIRPAPLRPLRLTLAAPLALLLAGCAIIPTPSTPVGIWRARPKSLMHRSQFLVTSCGKGAGDVDAVKAFLTI
jgi:hypothetical protein